MSQSADVRAAGARRVGFLQVASYQCNRTARRYISQTGVFLYLAMVASPTPIPVPRHRGADAPEPSHGSAQSTPLGRSPTAAIYGMSFDKVPARYNTPHSATLASQWHHTRKTSLNLGPPSDAAADALATSAPISPSPWSAMLRREASRGASASARSGASFTGLYRQISNSHRHAPRDEPEGLASSYGSSLSESPVTPRAEAAPPRTLADSPVPTASHRLAAHLEHADADGTWRHPGAGYEPAVPKDSPPVGRPLQRAFSASTKRRPSPMGERLIMGHFDTH